jgi:hypothetical protein
MTEAPTKRALPCSGYVRLADGTRHPVRIVEQGRDHVWITVWKPTRLPGGRILQPNETACVHRSHMRMTSK